MAADKPCPQLQPSLLLRGSSHIRSVLIGVKYRNCCRSLDVYLFFTIYLDGANSIKTDLHIRNL
jgi:hypothetical protein